MGDTGERASRGLARLEDITRMMSEWVWETDVEGNLTFVSDRFSEVLGFMPVQVIGKRFTDIGAFRLPAGDPFEPEWGKPFRDVLFVMNDINGVEKSFLFSGMPFYHPETWTFEGVSGTVNDITQRLRDEIQLKAAKDLAEQASLAKSSFLSSMSHELRTPLNSVLGFAQILKLELDGGTDDRHKKAVNQILSNGNLLLSLINDLLDLSRIEGNNLSLDITDTQPGALIALTIESVRPVADHRAITLVNNIAIKDPPVLRIDGNRFTQILLNLLSNAVKYNTDGGHITIAGDISKKGFFRISVTDTGPGIPAEHRAKLFQPFNRLGRESGNVEGTGIGLSISKNLVTMMGGTIGYEDVPGGGSLFWIELPAASQAGG